MDRRTSSAGQRGMGESFQKIFKFTECEIVNEFLMSIFYLQDTHVTDCLDFEKIRALGPAWQNT